MKRYLIFMLVLISKIGFSQAGLDSALVAYFPFDGDAKDYSGNNNNGTIFGDVEPAQDRFGNDSSAYYFSGIEGRIVVENSDEISFSSISDSYSVCFWVKADSTDFNACRIIEKWDELLTTSTPLSVQAGKSNCKIVVYEAQEKKSVFNYIDNLWDTNWHSIAISINAQTKTISTYFDNTLVDLAQLPFEFSNKNSIPWYIGGNYSYYGGRFFKGYLDDVRIYNQALSAEEVVSLYSVNITTSQYEEKLNDIQIYPNPTADVVKVNIGTCYEQGQNIRIRIIDVSGRVVLESPLYLQESEITLDKYGASGLYLIQIIDSSDEIIETRKVMLK